VPDSHRGNPKQEKTRSFINKLRVGLAPERGASIGEEKGSAPSAREATYGPGRGNETRSTKGKSGKKSNQAKKGGKKKSL